MADVPPLNYKQLTKKLQRFHTTVSPLLADCGIGLNCDFGLKKSSDPSRFELTNFIVLKNVPQRSNSKPKKQKLTIFIHFRGELTDRDLVKSFNTRVTYSVSTSAMSPNSVNLVRGVHYDFETDTKIFHPVCHVQEDLKTLCDEIGDSDYEIKNSDYVAGHISECLKYTNSVRIPTAFIDFFSIIIMILADHCIDHFNTDQLEKFNEIVKKVIKDPSTILINTENLCDDSSMKASKVSDQHSVNWYVTKKSTTNNA